MINNSATGSIEAPAFLEKHGSSGFVEALTVFDRLASLRPQDRIAILAHMEAAARGDDAWSEDDTLIDLAKLILNGRYPKLMNVK